MTVNRVEIEISSDETMTEKMASRCFPFQADGNEWALVPPQHLSKDFRNALAKLLMQITDGRDEETTVPAMETSIVRNAIGPFSREVTVTIPVKAQ